MKVRDLISITRISVLVVGLAGLTVLPTSAQTNGNAGNANMSPGNTTVRTEATSTPRPQATSTTRTETTRTVERETSFPWGLLGLLGLAGLIPQKRKTVEVEEFRDTRQVKSAPDNQNVVDNQTTTDNRTTDNQTNR
ncbi:MAG: WGxxGxxG family protein [Pyrinomonadaceae bacterium]